MIVCALGYGPVVQVTEPWYNGYITIANSIGVTKGAAGVADTPAVRGLVAQLIDNMGDCKALVQSGVNADGTPSYSVSSGNEITGQETYESEGVLVGVYDNSLRGEDSRLTKSTIDINNKIYELDSSIDYENLIPYLGQAVTYKWYESRNTKYITSVRTANNTDIYTVKASLIDEFDGSKLYYYEDEDDDDTSYYSIGSDIYVVYNGYGVAAEDITTDNLKTWFDIDCGSLTFYNNDNDKDMDVVYVEKYETYYVSAPVTNKGVTTITDKNDTNRKAELDEDDVIVTKVTSLGGSEGEAKLTSITNGNVVSVAKPLNVNGKTTVKISSATASGSISEMGEDYDGVKIGSTKYAISEYFRDFLAQDEAKYGFSVGSNVKFYLDYTGAVVFSDVTVTSDPYGYLIDYVTEDSMGDGGVTVRLLNTSNKIVTYELRSKVKINGTSRDEDEVIGQLEDSAGRIEAEKSAEYSAPMKGSNGPISQIIRYKTGTENGKTVISEIMTVTTDNVVSADGENGGIVPAWFSSDGSAKTAFNNCDGDDDKLECSGTSTTSKSFKSSDGTTQFSINSSTIVFKLPYGRSDTEEFRYAKGVGSFSNSSKYYVEPYDITGTTAAAVVYYASQASTGANVGANSNSYIILSKKVVINEDKKSVHEITYVTVGDDINDESKIKTIQSSDSKLLADYKAGDIIRFATSGGVIEDVEQLFIYSDKLVYNREGSAAANNSLDVSYNGKSDYFQAHYGKAYAVDADDNGAGSIAVLIGDSQENYELYSITADTKYYKLDDDDDVVGSNYIEITDVDNTDYDTASNVLVISYDGKVKGVYVINE